MQNYRFALKHFDFVASVRRTAHVFSKHRSLKKLHSSPFNPKKCSFTFNEVMNLATNVLVAGPFFRRGQYNL